MTNPSKWQPSEVGQRLSGAALVELCGRRRTPKHRGNLEVHERRSAQPLPPQPVTRAIAIAAVVGKRRGEHRRVDDDHVRSRSRSDRSVSIAFENDTLPPARPPARSSTSSSVSCRASAVNRESRYS